MRHLGDHTWFLALLKDQVWERREGKAFVLQDEMGQRPLHEGMVVFCTEAREKNVEKEMI